MKTVRFVAKDKGLTGFFVHDITITNESLSDIETVFIKWIQEMSDLVIIDTAYWEYV